MKRRIWLGIAAGICLLACAAWFLLSRSGHLLPSWISWETAQLSCRPEAGEPDQIVLERRTATVFHQGEAVWQSDREVRVQDVLWGDIDHDGAKELMLLCWKRGRYGDSRPFWVTEDETTWSQHIYLYDWTDGEIRPIWMASNIGMDAVSWSFDETSRLVITDRSGTQSAWDWISWGLSSLGSPTSNVETD